MDILNPVFLELLDYNWNLKIIVPTLNTKRAEAQVGRYLQNISYERKKENGRKSSIVHVIIRLLRKNLHSYIFPLDINKIREIK